MLPSSGKAQKIKAKEKLILWKKQQAEKKAYEEQKERDRLRTVQKAIEQREKRAEVRFKTTSASITFNFVDVKAQF